MSKYDYFSRLISRSHLIQVSPMKVWGEPLHYLPRRLRWEPTHAEHPTVSPMDTTPTLQAPSGPMTRARARAIKNEVSSLLSDFHFDALGMWLLPQAETLCMLRYQGNSHGEAMDQGQALTEAEREEEEQVRVNPAHAWMSGLLSG